MKKRLFTLSMAVVCLCTTATAQTETADTVIVENPKRVTIISDSTTLSVEVEGRTDDPDFRFSKSQTMADDGLHIFKENSSDVNFRLPFSSSKNVPRHGTMEFSISQAMSLGMVSAIGGPDNLSTNFGQSFEITWHAANITFKFNKLKHWSFGTGLWCNWKNYRMTGYTRFQKADNVVVLNDYATGSVIRFSRLHLYSWQVPLLATYRTNNKHLRSTFGLLFNFNSHGNLKTRYSLGGENYKEVEGGIHLNSFTVDLYATLNYHWLGAYVKWSPCPVLESGMGPRFSGISTGLMIFW